MWELTVCSTYSIKGLFGKNTFQWWLHMDWDWYPPQRLVFPASLVNPTGMGYF